MDHLISRQAAIAYAVSGRIRALPTTEDGEDWIRVSEVRESLQRVPTIEPKKGKWLRTDAYPHHIYCSVCFKTYIPNDEWDIWKSDGWLPKNFCPNCGADMREPESPCGGCKREDKENCSYCPRMERSEE